MHTFKRLDKVELLKNNTVELSISKVTQILIYKTNTTPGGSVLITLHVCLVSHSTLKNTNIKPHTLHYVYGLYKKNHEKKRL